MALTALQYLPHPIMVLSSSKEVILANEAMGRLLGIEDLEDEQESGEDESSNIKSVTDILYGATFSQLGFDVLQGMWNGSNQLATSSCAMYEDHSLRSIRSLKIVAFI